MLTLGGEFKGRTDKCSRDGAEIVPGIGKPAARSKRFEESNVIGHDPLTKTETEVEIVHAVKEMTTHYVDKLEVAYQEVEVNRSLKIPAGWDLTGAEGKAAIHDAEFGVSVVAHFGFDGGKEDSVQFGTLFGVEGCGREDVTELGMKIDWDNHISFVNAKVNTVKTTNRAAKDLSDFGELSVVLAARRGPYAEGR